MDLILENIDKKFINNDKKFNKLYNDFNDIHLKIDKINEMIDIINSDDYKRIYKKFLIEKNYDLRSNKFFIHKDYISINLRRDSFIIFEYTFNCNQYIEIPIVIRLIIDNVLPKDFQINLGNFDKIKYDFKLNFNIIKINFSLYLINNKVYDNEKFEYMRNILFNNKKIKFNIFSYNI